MWLVFFVCVYQDLIFTICHIFLFFLWTSSMLFRAVRIVQKDNVLGMLWSEEVEGKDWKKRSENLTVEKPECWPKKTDSLSLPQHSYTLLGKLPKHTVNNNWDADEVVSWVKGSSLKNLKLSEILNSFETQYEVFFTWAKKFSRHFWLFKISLTLHLYSDTVGSAYPQETHKEPNASSFMEGTGKCLTVKIIKRKDHKVNEADLLKKENNLIV